MSRVWAAGRPSMRSIWSRRSAPILDQSAQRSDRPQGHVRPIEGCVRQQRTPAPLQVQHDLAVVEHHVCPSRTASDCACAAVHRVAMPAPRHRDWPDQRRTRARSLRRWCAPDRAVDARHAAAPRRRTRRTAHRRRPRRSSRVARDHVPPSRDRPGRRPRSRPTTPSAATASRVTTPCRSSSEAARAARCSVAVGSPAIGQHGRDTHRVADQRPTPGGLRGTHTRPGDQGGLAAYDGAAACVASATPAAARTCRW